jgi:hypothetical protein
VAILEAGNMADKALEQYTILMQAFLKNSINVKEFEYRYLEMFKNENTLFPSDIFKILDELFAAVDAFCSEPELCDEDDLNEQQLRAKTSEALARLADK